jgi:pimeloyl-ACP methyl ester carboxylesterase
VTPERLSSFRRNGWHFDVSDSGPSDGIPVVLLHGFPGSRRTWREVIPVLNASGLRTIAFDQRGYSPGARPDRRRDYRAAEVTADVLALLTASGLDRVHLAGHDWGGFVAWRFAAATPERLTGITVLSTPHPAAMLRSMLSSGQIARSAYIGFFQLPWLPEFALRGRLARLLAGSDLPEPIAEDYARFLSTPTALTSALNWYRGMWLPDRRSRPFARAPISVPTTYVWGRYDQALGRRAAELTRDYVHGEYRFVELDENHWLPERAPVRVAEEILAGVNRAFTSPPK